MQHRYDFVYLFDVKDGNPNGDPDASNAPRIDPETGHGLVTDVCLKRKIRNYIGIAKKETPPFEIYVKEKAVLNLQHKRAYDALNVDPVKRNTKDRATDDRHLTQWMCKNFYDIRAFGAVMTTEINCGQVRGPIQMAIARSVEPVAPLEYTVTRCAVTSEREAEKQQGNNRTMGHKSVISYALYRAHGYINPHLASQTGFDENGEDLDLFWTSLAQMFELDRSASRGEMAPQSLIVFEHASTLGNAPANKLFDRVRIERKHSAGTKAAVVAKNENAPPARRFSDYALIVDESNIPAGITVHRKI